MTTIPLGNFSVCSSVKCSHEADAQQSRHLKVLTKICFRQKREALTSTGTCSAEQVLKGHVD